MTASQRIRVLMLGSNVWMSCGKMATKAPASGNPMTSEYDSFSIYQLQANEYNLPLLSEALTATDPHGQVLHIGDFGSATGLNSMKTFSQAFRSFRETSDTQISVHHVDLPNNSWGVLFNNAATSPYSYLTIKDTFVEGVGRSIYGQVFPDNYLSIVYSTFALQWLSNPLDSPNQVQRYLANPDEIIQELSLIAEDDLDKFLLSRTSELKVGGRMILHTPATHFNQSLFYTAYQTMIADGLVPAETIQNVRVTMHSRSESEFLKSVSKLSDRLRVVQVIVSDHPNDFFSKLIADGDKEVLVLHIIGMLRSASESVWRKVMELPEGPNPLLDELYKRFGTSLLEGAGKKHVQNQLHVVLEKIA